MSYRVSVVVPTYKRPKLLCRALQALVAQDFNPADYEIIVVDDAASRKTEQLVNELAGSGRGRSKRPSMRYIPNQGPNHGPAAARNLGWRSAQGEIIAFTDDDCIPDRCWLRIGTAVFTPEIVGASGMVVVPLPDEPTDYERSAAGIEGVQFLTANCFYRREALAAVGGFDERFTRAWREDTDIFFALLQQFGDSCFCHVPEAYVTHPLRPAPWGISVQEQKRSIFNALLYKKHPALYREVIQPHPPWRYYQIVTVLVLALLGVVAGWNLLTLGAVMAWFWLTAGFCLRRLRQTSHTPLHVVEMVVTSAVIPPMAVFWRLAGAVKYRVLFF